jgi:hypothetical protein
MATYHMAVACQAYSLAVHNSSAGGVVDLVRHLGRIPAKEVWVTSVGTNASVLVWEMLLMGCQPQGFVRHHSSVDALGHARGGVADIARNRSW